MFDWDFEYEQCPIKKTWVYKFDHEPIADGNWHELNSKSGASYRISNEYLQFVSPGPNMPSGQVDEVLAAFVKSGPLETDDELEIVIRRQGDTYDMWSHWVYLDEGVKLENLTSSSLNDAYARLCDLED